MVSYIEDLVLLIGSSIGLKFLTTILAFLFAIWSFVETREIETFVGALGFGLILNHSTRMYGLIILALYVLIIMVEYLIQREEEIKNKQIKEKI
ncbi:hypothetical protein V7D15_07230 [Thermoanaerobacter thermohydrosulfuricus]